MYSQNYPNNVSGGTSILDLKRKKDITTTQQMPHNGAYGQTGYGGQHIQGMQSGRSSQRTYSAAPQYSTQPKDRIVRKEKKRRRRSSDIDSIINGINDKISHESSEESIENDTESIEDIEDKEKTEDKSPEKQSLKKKMLMYLKDFGLLWFLYFLASQNFAKNFAGSYFKSINPDEDGVVGWYGIGLYGLIIVSIYFVLRYILVYKLG